MECDHADTSKDDILIIILAAIGASVATVLLLLLVVCMIRRHRHKKHSEKTAVGWDGNRKIEDNHGVNSSNNLASHVNPSTSEEKLYDDLEMQNIDAKMVDIIAPGADSPPPPPPVEKDMHRVASPNIPDRVTVASPLTPRMTSPQADQLMALGLSSRGQTPNKSRPFTSPLASSK